MSIDISLVRMERDEQSLLETLYNILCHNEHLVEMAPENYQDTKQYKNLLFEFSAIQKKSIWLNIKNSTLPCIYIL